jgi:hypothetical protein
MNLYCSAKTHSAGTHNVQPQQAPISAAKCVVMHFGGGGNVSLIVMTHVDILK